MAKNDVIIGFTNKKHGDFSSKILKKFTTQQLLQKLGKNQKHFRNFYFMEQVHKTNIKIVDKRKKHFIKGVDGLITNQKGILLLVKTADCLPVLVSDSKKKVIAVIHSGWRGTVDKIVPKTISKMVNHFHSKPQDLQIFIEPCAHKCCYKTSKTELKDLSDWQKFLRKKSNFYYIDLVGKLGDDLIKIGIKKKNIKINPTCTICNKHFFSYTRFKKGKEQKGLFISYIGLPLN